MDENEKIFAEARQAGIDLDLMDTIMAQPITERWRHHNAALNLMLKLETAKKAHYARPDDSAETSR
jgi:hypothetical protein